MSIPLTGSTGFMTAFGWFMRLIRTLNGQRNAALGQSNEINPANVPAQAFKGSGFTFSSTPSGGALATITLVAGGSNYPASSTLQFSVTSGTGTGAVVQATTNSSGVVASVTGTPVSAGSGFANSLTTFTTAPQGTPSWGSGATIYDLGDSIQNCIGALTSGNQSQIGTLDSLQSQIYQAMGQPASQLATVASQVLTQMAQNDTPQTNSQLATIVALLVSQMITNSQYITKPTVSYSGSAGGSNTGTWKLFTSIYNTNGLSQDYIVAETLTATCTNDALHSATAGSEPLTLTTPAPASSDPFDVTSPSYTGINVTTNIINPMQSFGTGGVNLLVNSADITDATTANVPDNWSIVTGTAGTTVKVVAGEYYATSVNDQQFQFVGNGSELTSISQQFNNTAGTAATLLPNTMYFVGITTKVSATPSTGVLTIKLVNAGNTVYTDNAGNPCVFSVALTGESTTFAQHGGFFCTPAAFVGAATAKIIVQLTTALDNAKTVTFDGIVMAPAQQLQGGPYSQVAVAAPNMASAGPYVMATRGGTDALQNDTYSMTYSNNWKTGAVFALMLQQAFGLTGLGFQIPSSASPTIAESLIN